MKMAESWTVEKMIDWTVEYFDKNSIPESRMDAEVLLSFVLDCPRLELHVKKDRELSKSDQKVELCITPRGRSGHC